MDACCVCVLNSNMAGLSLSTTKAKPLDRWQIWETGQEKRRGPFWTGKTLVGIPGLQIWLNSCKSCITSLNRLQLDYANPTGASGDSAQFRPVLLVHWSLSFNRLTLNEHATTSFRLLGLNDDQEPVALRKAMILEVDSLDMSLYFHTLYMILLLKLHIDINQSKVWKVWTSSNHPPNWSFGERWLKKAQGKPGQQLFFFTIWPFLQLKFWVWR